MSDQIEAAGALATAGLAAHALDGPGAGHAAHGGACANCAAPLSGPFCAQCGQRAHIHRTIGEVFHEFLHGITHFDGKAWKTLPMLLFRPGTLTRSYIDGHRARYIGPVPLFLLVVFVMFFVLSFVSLGDVITDNRDTAAGQKAGVAEAMTQIDRDISAARARGETAKVAELENSKRLMAIVGAPGPSASLVDRLAAELSAAEARGELKMNLGSDYLNERARAAIANPRLVLYKLQTKAYKLSFLLVPLSLPWLWLAFVWKRGIGLYDHAIFTLYSISFMSLVFVAASLLITAGVTSDIMWTPFVLAPGIHMFAQLRGAYNLNWFSAGWRTVYLSVAAVSTLSLYLVLLVVIGVLD